MVEIDTLFLTQMAKKIYLKGNTPGFCSYFLGNFLRLFQKCRMEPESITGSFFPAGGLPYKKDRGVRRKF